MTGPPIVWVDAFTDRPFAGNPAAVCLLDAPAATEWMRALAREMNLSETAFVVPLGEAYRLRWFTPTVEVDLCGHATLAAAHAVWEEGWRATDREVEFETRSGRLTARRREEWIALDFPATPPVEVEPPRGLAEALGIDFPAAGRTATGDLLVEAPDEAAVRALAPDFEALARVEARGVIVTAPATTVEADFVSRFFAPGVGVPEDPVTGSAHCALGPFWGRRLGRRRLTGHQVGPRGGTVRVETRGDRVLLEGRAVTILRGEAAIEPVPFETKTDLSGKEEA